MNNNKVNCDTRVTKLMKNRLTDIARVFGVKRADVQRAAFARYIAAFDAGLLKQEIVQDEKEK